MHASIDARTARQLCTKQELELVRSSYSEQITDLNAKQLKEKIARARRLRDKFRDLAGQQRGEARGKRKPQGTRPAAGNDRTVLKAQLFDETLERFQTRYNRVNAGA